MAAAMNNRPPWLRENSPRRRKHISVALTVGMLACLPACTTQATVSHIKVAPAAFADEVEGFAMMPAENDASSQAAILVEHKLEALGYTASIAPDYLVEVSATRHSTATGALIPSADADASYIWVEKPKTKRANTKKIAVTLRVRFLTPDTRAPVVISTSRLVVSNGVFPDSTGKLVDAMFATDPLKTAQPPALAAGSD